MFWSQKVDNMVDKIGRSWVDIDSGSHWERELQQCSTSSLQQLQAEASLDGGPLPWSTVVISRRVPCCKHHSPQLNHYQVLRSWVNISYEVFFFFYPPADGEKLTTLPRIFIRVACRFNSAAFIRSISYLAIVSHLVYTISLILLVLKLKKSSSLYELLTT